MSRSRKSAALAGIAVAGAIAALCGSSPAAAYAGEPGRELWGAVTIVPGREGVVEVAGYAGPPLGAGSSLTLTAPDGIAVRGVPLDARGYRGALARDGGSGTYTFTGAAAAEAWRGRVFPFVLAVPRDVVPGTRPRGCALWLTDASGLVRQRGACAVTVGLPEPKLTRPESGVPLPDRPEVSGTAYPGAQVTVRDATENEVCATTAGTDGTWSCVPGPALAAGAGRLQATASLNGVSATSEQIQITVRDASAKKSLSKARR
ncbi:Ig-like domain-containing protein [Streptomyces sp. NPDC002838]|uniref:Ig-like domain-containing protein n=1 Tax=Streptomyces sp. NPDC002838 TaxID=3154436 RepID=UPI00331BD290